MHRTQVSHVQIYRIQFRNALGCTNKSAFGLVSIQCLNQALAFCFHVHVAGGIVSEYEHHVHRALSTMLSETSVNCMQIGHRGAQRIYFPRPDCDPDRGGLT
jgi:hypothetical protein